LFAAARQLAGQAAIEVQLPEPATVGHIRAALRCRCPELERLLPHARFAVNAEYAGDDAPIRPGDVLALIPPVSGG
jgi:molybdopterin converting factor subunit 1